MKIFRRFDALLLIAFAIGLTAVAVLPLIPWVVDAQTTNQSATGRPRVLAAAQGASILFADTEGINDGNGLSFEEIATNAPIRFNWSYQWIRVDGDSETNVGADSASYHPVQADVGKRIKVKVSFTDGANYSESRTSLPFGPIAEVVGTTQLPFVLVTNREEGTLTTANITQQYAIGFKLGDHGRGYEISSVIIGLAAAPSSLTVSLWSGGHSEAFQSNNASKLFDFANPASFAVGNNEFTAPAGAFAYQNFNYFVVLSGFGSSLSILETSDNEEGDEGVSGAIIYDDAAVRDLTATGRWAISEDRTSVLELTVMGSKRGHGIIASNYAQPFIDDKGTVDTMDDTGGDQEIVSVGDTGGIGIELGAADRYLIRGVSFNSDDTTPSNGGFTNPFSLRSGTLTGAKQFSLVNTRNVPGLPVWTAPRGATVAGGCTTSMGVETCKKYVFDQMGNIGSDTGDVKKRRRISILTRYSSAESDGVDSPAAAGVSFTGATDDIEADDPYMALLGEPLHAMVQNLGQADDGYRSVGGANRKVLSQGFTTGSNVSLLQGIGVNIEGSGSSFPDGPTSVSVAVHADSGGKPGAKLFDLVSPDEFAAGHSFFEAPPGTTLAPNTSYVVAWRHIGGTVHRMRKTSSNGEDTGALSGFSLANTFYQGVDLDNMAADPGSDVLEIAVYRSRKVPNATGRPRVLASPEGTGILFADPARIKDTDGLPFAFDGPTMSVVRLRLYYYQWIRVDAETAAETLVGVDSPSYQRVDADVGHLMKVRVSFFDQAGAFESLTSLPFGPVHGRPALLRESTLVANTGQSASAEEEITGQYAMGFRLGGHGQGYEISSVSIDLAAAPSSLTVSLWAGGREGMPGSDRTSYKLFDFANPSSFRVGLNEFTAPGGAFAYQNVNYYIVLSGFGASLKIKETTSNNEDSGGETGAVIFDSARTRGLHLTGVWRSSTSRSSVLRMAVKGSQRERGILIANYAQAAKDELGATNQEIVSVGDLTTVEIDVGEADRYLVRGVSFQGDGTNTVPAFPSQLGVSSTAGPMGDPMYLWNTSSRTDSEITKAAALFSMATTRSYAGISVWTAPQGSTVAGASASYFVGQRPTDPRLFSVLGRFYTTEVAGVDMPTAEGVAFATDATVGDGAWGDGRPLMAVLGEPLDAMVQNFDQTTNSYASATATNPVLSQGFTTGSNDFPYRLQGIGFEIEGSGSEIPDGPTSVSVAVYTADTDGKPGEKLFDLASPADYAVGHSFFEAPPRAYLEPDTPYVVVWTRLGGTAHRLERTTSNSEDTGAATGASLADVLYRGADVNNLSPNSGGNSLALVVYTEVLDTAIFVEGGIPVPLNWFHISDGAYAGYQFRALFVTHHAINAEHNDIEIYNKLVQLEASGRPKRYPEASGRSNDPVIRRVAEQFKAVVCTAADKNARTNTGMEGSGVPIHWLDGGAQHRDTLVANSNSQFFGPEWVQDEWGAIVTGNSTPLFEISVDEATRGDKIAEGIWTGCDSTGMAHMDYHLGSAMGMATLGTPADESTGNAPIGPTASSTGMVALPVGEYRSIYAISPVFTVVDDGSERTIWSSRMTVGTNTFASATITEVTTGYVDLISVGSIEGSKQFTYEGGTYSVVRLRILKETTSGTVSMNFVNLGMSSLPPEGTDSKLALELTCWGSCRGEQQGSQRTRFLLSEATRVGNGYSWDNPGLPWADGDEVVIRLIELRD